MNKYRELALNDERKLRLLAWLSSLLAPVNDRLPLAGEAEDGRTIAGGSVKM
jgi:hypothetical protein